MRLVLLDHLNNKFDEKQYNSLLESLQEVQQSEIHNAIVESVILKLSNNKNNDQTIIAKIHQDLKQSNNKEKFWNRILNIGTSNLPQEIAQLEQAQQQPTTQP